MTLRRYILILLACLTLSGVAQQVGMFNYYYLKPFVYNPAFAGNGESAEATLISRMQWSGFNGAPQLNIFTLDGAVKEKKVGMGLNVVNERRGINQRNGGQAAYAYRLGINDETYFLFGISAGIINQSIDFSKAVAENYTDPTLFGGMQQKTTFDGNAGVGFVWKGLELGASAPQLFSNSLNYVDNTGTRTFYAQARHYMASAKYKIAVTQDKGISVVPQFVARIVPNAPLQFDGILSLNWENKFWLGAMYKSNYAIGINAGICIQKKLSIGYSYEVITGDIGKYAGMSHEILVNFKFGGKKKEVNEDSVRIAEENRLAKEAAYQQRIDSLQEALAANQDRIRELNKKVNEQAKTQQQTQAQVQALENKMNTLATQTANNQQPYIAPQVNQNNTQNTATTQNKTSANNQNTANNQQVNTSTSNTNKNPEVNQSNVAANQNAYPAALNMMDSKVKEDEVWIASYPTTDYKNDKDQVPQPAYYIVVGTFFYRDFAEAEAERFRKKGYKACNLIYSEITKHNYIFTHKMSSRQESISKVKEIQRSGVTDAWILQLK